MQARCGVSKWSIGGFRSGVCCVDLEDKIDIRDNKTCLEVKHGTLNTTVIIL